MDIFNNIKVTVTKTGKCTFTVDSLHYVLDFASLNGMSAAKQTKYQGSHLYAGCELIYMPYSTARQICTEYQLYNHRMSQKAASKK